MSPPVYLRSAIILSNNEFKEFFVDVMILIFKLTK